MARAGLSSRGTLFYKFLFPAFWIAGFGAGTVLLWSPGVQWSPAAPPLAVKLAFAVCWLAGSTFILWFASTLKRVSLDGGTLVVSNDFTEVVLPLDSIVAVDQDFFMNPRRVHIRLRSPSPFGPSISFIPRETMVAWPWSPHPVVNELRRAANLPTVN